MSLAEGKGAVSSMGPWPVILKVKHTGQGPMLRRVARTGPLVNYVDFAGFTHPAGWGFRSNRTRWCLAGGRLNAFSIAVPARMLDHVRFDAVPQGTGSRQMTNRLTMLALAAVLITGFTGCAVGRYGGGCGCGTDLGCGMEPSCGVGGLLW